MEDTDLTRWTQLTQLDLRGCPVSHLQPDLLKGLQRLTSVYSDTFKLCCSSELPVSVKACFSPPEDLSPCENLITSDGHRFLLATLAVLTMLGNVVCFIHRGLFDRREGRGTQEILVDQIGVCDLLMGVYLTTLGLADLYYKGRYVLHDVIWRRGQVCRMSSVLATWSSVASPLLVFLMVLERLLLLRHLGPGQGMTESVFI